MGITTTVDSVAAEDPYRQAISAIAGRDQAIVKFTPTNSTGGAITAYRIEMGGGTAPGTGQLMVGAGFPCSDSLAEAVCSDSDANALCTDGINAASGAQITETVTYAETGGPADQSETIYVWVAATDTALS